MLGDASSKKSGICGGGEPLQKGCGQTRPQPPPKPRDYAKGQRLNFRCCMLEHSRHNIQEKKDEAERKMLRNLVTEHGNYEQR